MRLKGLKVRETESVCVCGMFEKASVAKDPSNSAEVPASFELKTLLAVDAKKGWRVGSLDIMTAFLHAELCAEEDGIIIVTPPTTLVRTGIVPRVLSGCSRRHCTV